MWKGSEKKEREHLADLDLDGTKYVRVYHWFKAVWVRLSGLYRQYVEEQSCYTMIC
jgi:hypothetical protein